MSFLIGLSESYAQVRGQILLMDLIPPINKVFSLITQEEKQRNAVNHNTGNDSISFNVNHEVPKNNQGWFGKKDRLLCTHYGLHGHTIDNCYKLHGYPLGYKYKQKNPNQVNSNQVKPIVGQVCDTHCLIILKLWETLCRH